MRDWLVAEGVTIAAIESTSTYWKPPFYCLEEVMDVWLLNAQHMKAVPGTQDRRARRGVDRATAGARVAAPVVRAAAGPIRRLRLLTRYRDQLMADRTREMIRLELMLEDASHQAVGGGVEPEDGLGAGHAGRDDRRRGRPARAGRSGQGRRCGARSRS